MSTQSINLKSILLRGLPMAIAFAFMIPQAHAAKYLLGDNTNLVKGCTGTVEIKIDTQGANVMAGDSTININGNEYQVGQISIGSAMPMQVFNQVTDSQVKLSAARLPASGNFSGVGTFGYITFTPNPSASSGTFTFAPDLTSDNTLVDENINNVLTGVENKTYSFRDRYDLAVDGVGFCTPDITKPVVQFINPVSFASSVPADSHVVFALTDDRSGVDMNSLSFTVDGVSFNSSSPEVSVTSDNKLFRVDMTPAQPFKAGASVSVKVHACDRSAPANCTDANNTFQVFIVTTAPAVCGNGIVEPGEQCDHGTQNGTSGDSCSSLCLGVVIVQSAPLSQTISCFDGFHNGAETGVDCGGPCKSCPNCVDGLQNQEETGVDCGGPCPACEQKSKVVCEIPVETTPQPVAEQPAASLETAIICHTPDNDPKHPYTMMIFKSSLADYLKKGDTEGACSTEEMCSALMPVAPEIEKKAAEQATVTLSKEQTVTVQNTVIEAPKTQQSSSDLIATCTVRYPKANFIDPSADTDGDGLSDRTECYALTNPLIPDTDADGCTDGDELNRFNTNPLDPTDCKLAVKTEEGFNQVLITDPKPAWTLGNLSPRFSGIVPLKSTAVTVTAFHADQKTVKALSAGVNTVNQASDLDAAKKAISDLKTATADARKFIDLNGVDFNYADLQTVVSKIETQVDSLDKAYGAATSFVSRDYFETLKKLGFGDLGLELGGLLRDPVVIGSTNQLSQSLLADQQVGSFELLPATPLDDQKLYDVVATATLAAKTVSSTPIQFGINTGFTVSKPIPRTLGGKLIPAGQLSFGGILIDTAYAQDGSTQSQIEIDQARPVITGDTEFGSQVFAIWNSVVLSSSVISDSEQGAFEIQAPKDLETNTAHRVTLYAVKTDKNKTLRSESVDIYFRVKGNGGNALPIAVGSVGLLALAGGAYWLIRRLRETRSVIRYLRGSSRR